MAVWSDQNDPKQDQQTKHTGQDKKIGRGTLIAISCTGNASHIRARIVPAMRLVSACACLRHGACGSQGRDWSGHDMERPI